MNKPYRLACLVTHPIQYQAPMFRYLAADPALSLTVFFLTDLTAGPHYDPGFRTQIEWDTPLGGYSHRFLAKIDKCDRKQRLSFWRPSVHGLWRLMASGRFDALWVHGYGHHGLLRAILYARANRVPVLLRGDSRFGPPTPRTPNHQLKHLLLPRLFGFVDAFLAIGSANRDYYRHYGVSEDRIFMTPYAVDNDFFTAGAEAASRRREAFRAELALTPGRPVILYAGKLQRLKRVNDLLEACAGLAHLRPYLLIAGDGGERDALQARARALRFDSARWPGFQNQTRMPAFYDLCDLLVLPSDNEAWGLVLNEVMNAGKPVIASDRVGAARDLIREGINGHIVPASDVAALRDAIASVLANPARAARMGDASRKIVSKWNFQAGRAGLLDALEQLPSIRQRRFAYLHMTYQP
ncbi:MAG TPA: glycosyltransferase family 4 protein [Candidatus Binataceae bacterium]|nr:glycosyltransferase family 4 protein [Candidatus Binataceae bacterium]